MEKISNIDLNNFLEDNIIFFQFLKNTISESEIVCGASFDRAEKELRDKILKKYKVLIDFKHDSNLSEISIKFDKKTIFSLFYGSNNNNDLNLPLTIELSMDTKDSLIKLDPYSTNIYDKKENLLLVINYNSEKILFQSNIKDDSKNYLALNNFLKSDFEKSLKILKNSYKISQEDIDLFKLNYDIILESNIPDNYKYLKNINKLNINERKKSKFQFWKTN